MTLRVALVGGPMYDGLYGDFGNFGNSAGIGHDVEVVVHADHPTLNREVAERLGAGERLDVISTHGKYAASQAQWLRPLDDLVPPEVIGALAPRAVDLCRFEEALLCVPRNIDVRVMWWRTDLADAPPVSWDDVEASPLVFGFTGRESGLFGLFYELMAAAGAPLFDDDLRPTLTGAPARDAVTRLVRLAGQGPPEMVDWHYDEVDDALLDGRLDAAAAWPGGYDRIRSSDLYDRLAPAMYPGGLSYSGCHGWAIPQTCGDVPAAVAFIEAVASLGSARRDAQAGSIPAHVEALARHQPVDDTDARRLEITAETIEHSMLTYPPLARFPEVEDAGWGAIHDALKGELTPEEAVQRMQGAAQQVLGC
ncbi:MAG: extracellular solute-binding protein [Microthrixaceae bacterium]